MTAALGVAIHERSAAAMLVAIRGAEDLGVRNVWLTTGAGPDALTVFPAVAATTQRIHMGCAVVPTYPRHPLVVAQQTLDIDGLAPGRFTLGLGPSHAAIMQGRYGIAYQRPLEHTREFVAIVKQLLTGEQVDFEGKRFSVHAKLFGAAKVPVIVSALRANSFRLAGEICDGAVSWLCSARYLRDVALPALEHGARSSGVVRPKLIGHAFLALGAQGAQLQRGVDEFLVHYPRLTNYQEMFAAAGYPEARQGTWSQAMIDAVVLHGDEARCAQALEEFLSVSGCDEIILSIMPTGDDRASRLRRSLEWVGRQTNG